MALTRWNSINRLAPFNSVLDEFGGQTLFLRDLLAAQGVVQQWLAPVDVYETPEAVIVEAVLPGGDEQDLELSLAGSTLTIRAQFTHPDTEAERA